MWYVAGTPIMAWASELPEITEQTCGHAGMPPVSIGVSGNSTLFLIYNVLYVSKTFLLLESHFCENCESQFSQKKKVQNGFENRHRRTNLLTF